MKMNFLFRFSISFLALLFTLSSASAQKPVQNNSLQLLPDEKESAVVVNNMKVNQLTGIPLAVYNPNYQVSKDTPENMARQYLSANFKQFNLSKDLSELRYITTTETPAGYHVHFNQYIGSYPVLNSSTNITISRDNKVIFVSYGVKSSYAQKEMPDLQRVNVSSDQAMASAKMYLNLRSRTSLGKDRNCCIL